MDNPLSMRTMGERVFAQIKQWIISGELAPGEKVDQDAIAERLQVSKMPVRSALEKLAAQDFVQLHSHRGATVNDLSAEHLTEIYFVRCLLEEAAVKLAAASLSAADAQKLDGMIAEQERLAGVDMETMLAANRKFHMFIYELAGQPVMLGIIQRLWEQSERYRRILLGDRHMVDGSIQEHRQLVELMKSGSPEEAGRFLVEHNRKTESFVMQYIKQTQWRDRYEVESV
ncbi:hypothetical protein A7K91_12690 [Paenibacillus oryzae]|uniref:HTH gntR-type domain-containing protein n=1 Tax=Paenibacillus oryzae TaxID=1844972 RepID=A0A1A5YFJ6_9BACL|nr:GntR family transcriptional regulator [Paenibacillus oryzae]OBR64358.1 hypothetical protein A7K91_12690 [Paenibacillus oryzae]